MAAGAGRGSAARLPVTAHPRPERGEVSGTTALGVTSLGRCGRVLAGSVEE